MLLMLYLSIVTTLTSSSSGLLQQLSNRTLFCDDKAVFICRNEAQNYLDWIILTKQGAEFTFGFSIFFNSPVVRSGPESSSIKAEVNFVNSSFIISTVTFLRASKLNGTIITCDEETIIFVDLSANLTVEIQLYPSEKNITVKWKIMENHFYKFASSNESTMSISSNTSSTILDLINATYYLNISICPNDKISSVSQFAIHPCIFNEISERRATRSYTLYSNSTWKVKCNNTKIFITTCSEDGHWGTDVACTVTNGENYTMPMDDEEQGNKVTNANDPQAKIVLIVVPVITVFTAITIGMIPILSIILVIKKKKLSGKDLPIQTEIQELTYQKFNRTDNQAQTGQVGEPEYSSLLCNTINNRKYHEAEYATLSQGEVCIAEFSENIEHRRNLQQTESLKKYHDAEYATVSQDEVCIAEFSENIEHQRNLQQTESLKIKKMDYTDVDVFQNESHRRPIHIRVDYTDVHSTIRHKDEEDDETPPPVPPYNPHYGSPVILLKKNDDTLYTPTVAEDILLTGSPLKLESSKDVASSGSCLSETSNSSMKTKHLPISQEIEMNLPYL